VEQARRVAFRSVSIDLIFAAPGQTIEDWNATLNQALDLNPDHISVYGLTIEEKTPFGALYREGRLTIPDEETQRIMYDLAIDRLAEAGYRHYEVSNWARPGFECLHNLVYWTGADYLGLGPSAHSYCDGKRRANVRTLREYLTRIESGLSGVDFEETLTADQKVQEYILLRLRLMEGFDLEAFQTLFGQRACDTRRGALSRLIRSGFIEQTGTQVRLTRQGLCVADAVCAQLA
jgi:oxygen-independent coproporphyrinogen-3 oxidase